MDRFSTESRPSSITSYSHSIANSTRNLMEPSRQLEPPTAPFVSRDASYQSLNGASKSDFNPGPSRPGTPASLSINYVPSKFAPVQGLKQRRGRGNQGDDGPKRGGGREAFRAGESRMPDAADEDYDGIQSGWFGKDAGGHTAPKLKWNRFKWILFAANLVLSVCSLVALIFALLVWFNVFEHADIVRVGNRTELVLSTLAASLGVLTSLIGWAGILLNNRTFLAIYSFMLWLCFALLVTPGYITYKKRTFNLEGKINAQWSRELGADGRARVQDELHCCGYFSPYVEATVTQACYSRSILDGCKGPYLKFERVVLKRWYIIAFAFVPVQIAIMLAGLLCSNHVTYRFGKGMMPKAYRLSLNSMAVIMDNYANQLAEQYGTDVASEVLARSRSDLRLDQIPQVGYHGGR